MLRHCLKFASIEVHATATGALIDKDSPKRHFLHLAAALRAAHPVRGLLSTRLRSSAAGVKTYTERLQQLLILLMELAVGFVVSGGIWVRHQGVLCARGCEAVKDTGVQTSQMRTAAVSEVRASPRGMNSCATQP